MVLLIALVIWHKTKSKPCEQIQMSQPNLPPTTENNVEIPSSKKEITDWKLVLVNFENALPEDFEIDLANIDKTRKFDSRAIGALNEMMRSHEKGWHYECLGAIRLQKRRTSRRSV